MIASGPSAGSLLESRTGHLASIDLCQWRVPCLVQSSRIERKAQGSAPGFPRDPDHDLVYVEGHLGNLYLEKDVGRGDAYIQLFCSMSEVALDPDQTAALIRSLLNRGSSK